MSERTVGVTVSAPGSAAALSYIRRLEELGVRAAWSTSPGMGDAITLMTAAAAQTDRILLGTSIVQTWSAHPVGMAQHALVPASIAPGRFRLGVGPATGR